MAERPASLHPLWLRVWHGLHALLFLALAVSGLSLHYSDTGATVLPFALAVRVHDACGVAAAALYVFFVVKNATSGNLHHYSLPHPVLRAVAAQVGWYLFGMFRGAKRPHPRRRDAKLNPAQAGTYLLVMYALTPASVLSGVALLLPHLAPERVGGTAGVWPMALLHLATGWLLSLFLLLHLYMVTTGPTFFAYLREISIGAPAPDLAASDGGTADAPAAATARPGGADDPHPEEPPRAT